MISPPPPCALGHSVPLIFKTNVPSRLSISLLSCSSLLPSSLLWVQPTSPRSWPFLTNLCFSLCISSTFFSLLPSFHVFYTHYFRPLPLFSPPSACFLLVDAFSPLADISNQWSQDIPCALNLKRSANFCSLDFYSLALAVSFFLHHLPMSISLHSSLSPHAVSFNFSILSLPSFFTNLFPSFPLTVWRSLC